VLFKKRFSDGDELEIDGARVVLKLSRRSRRVSLRIDAARGVVLALAPNERRLGEAVAFAKERSAWIQERLQARPAGAPFAPGGVVTLRGVDVLLDAVPGASAARVVEGRIVSGGEGEAYSRRIERLLRAEAKRDLEARTEVHAQALGVANPKVGLADPRSRWGSCTPARGTIRYSWRLILAPPWILDYVAAHEVAHLLHADHSDRFWAVVHSLTGDHRPARAWLRAHGAGLHAAGRS
jgi:predicted metal-dependent hydrolase